MRCPLATLAVRRVGLWRDHVSTTLDRVRHSRRSLTYATRMARPRAQHRPGAEGTKSRTVNASIDIDGGPLVEASPHLIESMTTQKADGAASCRCATPPPCRDGGATRR